jgi:hypothetical protein
MTNRQQIHQRMLAVMAELFAIDSMDAVFRLMLDDR